MKNIVALSLLVFLFSCGAKKELPEVYQNNGVALDGFDVVAYFTEGVAKKGSDEFRCQYKDVVYHFSSKENQSVFVAEPDKYIPAYGGWCGYAIAEHSKKMAPDPESWSIQEGKLILFYDDILTKIQGGLKKKWDKKPTDHKNKADNNWETMKE